MISFTQFTPVDNVPIYLQIIGYIKREIVAGTIQDGDEIPSRRMLSALLGVNPNTIQKSYAILEEEGLIHSRAGAKSCICADESALRHLRQEILRGSLRSTVEDMKQMGLSLPEALEAIREFWEE